MKSIRKALPDIPVPEVYSHWIESDGRGFIVMAPLPGKLLHTEWKAMELDARESVVRDYRTIISHFRSLRPPPGTRVGAIDGGPAIDHRCSDMAFGGPYDTETDFNDFLLAQLDPLTADIQRETIAACLKANHELRFTHADLGPHNILVENGRITGVIDLEYAGWYPEYWEYVKMGHFGTAGNDLLWYARRFWGEGIFYDAYVKHGQ